MPFAARSLFCLLFYATLSALLSIRSVFGQDSDTSVIVNVNDTSRWSFHGNWALLHTLGDFSGNWLNATGFDATSASISFTGSGVVVFGTVVNGTGNQPMNVSVQLDSDRAFVPTYVPGSSISKGFDYNNQIVKNTSLPFQLHTLTLSITGPTPFFLQGILYNSANITSTTSPPVGTGSSSSDSSSDNAKLGGAIGGGIGALLLVGIIILCMMRRLRRIEKKEGKLRAIPFITNTGTARNQTGTYMPTSTTRSIPRTQSSTAVDEKIRMKEQPTATASSSRSIPRNHKSPIPSPAASLISIPSAYQPATTVVPAGTAVASSYIGASPLATVHPADAPPVPPIPADVKRKTKSIRRKEKQEIQEEKPEKEGKQGKNTHVDQSTLNSGAFGLLSTDTINTIGTTGSTGLSRPLPIVPGTSSSVPTFQFPPEKVGLSPPPIRRERTVSASKREKRPLPEPSSLPPS